MKNPRWRELAARALSSQELVALLQIQGNLLEGLLKPYLPNNTKNQNLIGRSASDTLAPAGGKRK